VWSGTLLDRGALAVHPLEVLPKVLERLTFARIWGYQLLMLLSFWVLIVGRIWVGHTLGAVLALAGGVVAVMISVAMRGDLDSVMYACNWLLLPGIATGLALGLALAIERRLLARVRR
jgi:hypothetical protein